MTDGRKRDIIIIIIMSLAFIGWGGVVYKYHSNNENNISYNLNYEGDETGE